MESNANDFPKEIYYEIGKYITLEPKVNISIVLGAELYNDSVNNSDEMRDAGNYYVLLKFSCGKVTQKHTIYPFKKKWKIFGNEEIYKSYADVDDCIKYNYHTNILTLRYDDSYIEYSDIQETDFKKIKKAFSTVTNILDIKVESYCKEFILNKLIEKGFEDLQLNY